MTTVPVIIGAGLTADLDLTEYAECGDAAAAIAGAHGVAGTLFSFKVDGVELHRYAPANGIAPDACVELVEVPVDGGEPGPAEDEEPGEDLVDE